MFTVAHLVSPYLFRTGSWIHTQLTHAVGTRPIVLTQAFENLNEFPFEPVFCVTRGLTRPGRWRNRLLTLAGRHDPRLYLPVLRQEHARVMHAHLGWEGARALAVARAAGLPLVTSFYGLDAGRLPRRPWWRRRYANLFRQGSLFLVEGPALAARLRFLGCPEHKIRIIHLGIDTQRIPFSERRIPADGTIEVLVSASLRPKKGVPAAVDAFAAAARDLPHTRLRILGDGPERPRVVAAIRRHHLEARTILEGYVSYRRHLDALGAAQIFLAPSRTAPDGDSEGGAPVALIEAQASGLPAVTTRHADIPEVVQQGAGGLLSDENDARALAENLRGLLTHPEQWPAMGQRGRKRIEEDFDAARQAERVAQVYREVAADLRSRGA